MKKSLSLLIALTIGLLSTGVKAQLIISQYIETTVGTTPKGIEIWNTSNATVDFATTPLVIRQGTNGGQPATLVTLSTGTLASGAVLVAGTSDMGTYLSNNGLSAVRFVNFNFQFNGDDALVLEMNGARIDVMGTPGTDPGTAWTGNNVSTANQNIGIKQGFITGNPDGFTDPSIRYQFIATGTDLSGFGLAPFIIDNEEENEPIRDTLAPTVLSSSILSKQAIRITFNELLDSSSAVNTNNYSGIANLNSITFGDDSSSVVLNFSPEFPQGQALVLSINGIADTAGNSMSEAFLLPIFFNASKPNVIISEINYNNPGDDNFELLELYNNGSDTAYLGGFSLSGIAYTFPASSKMAPKSYLLFSNNKTRAEGFYKVSNIIQWSSGALNNDGETIAISNSAGEVINAVSFKTGGEWPTAANGQGPSLELINPTLDNNIASNWRASFSPVDSIADGRMIFATPGYGFGARISIEIPEISIYENEKLVRIPLYSKNFDMNTTTAVRARITNKSTATIGQDFSYVDLPVIVKSNQRNYLEITLTDDNISEENETIEIELYAFGAGEVFGFTTATITLIDTDSQYPELCINEFLARNTQTNSDENGEFDPWIELHNPNNFAVEMGNYLINHNGINYQIQNGEKSSVAANGFLLLWADEQSNQGANHLGLRLQNSGSIRLIGKNATTIIDQISYTSSSNGTSRGRSSDCGPTLTTFNKPTPGQSNTGTTGIADLTDNKLTAYPNPVIGRVLQLNRSSDVKISNALGQVLIEEKGVSQLNLSTLPVGVYLLTSADGEQIKLVLP